MPKLTRKTLKLFGSSGPSTSFGQFGSKLAGAPQTSQDPSVLQNLAAWLTGWQDAVVAGNKAAYLEDMNGWCYVHSYVLAQLLQGGIPEWDASTSYYVGSYVRKDGTFELYGSLTNDNVGNALPNQTNNANWQFLNPTTTKTGQVDDFAGIDVPFGALLCDGAAHSRATFANLFSFLNLSLNGNCSDASPIVTAIASTAKIKVGWFVSGTGVQSGTTVLSVDGANQVTLSLPVVGTTVGNALVFSPWGIGDGTTTFNVPDLRGRGTIGAGTGSGLTARTLGAKLGAETHTLTEAEMPAHTHTQNFASPGGGGFNVGGSISGGPVATGSTGGGGAHNNMQPSAVMQKIIWY